MKRKRQDKDLEQKASLSAPSSLSSMSRGQPTPVTEEDKTVCPPTQGQQRDPRSAQPGCGSAAENWASFFSGI